jgi:hypothetical protein
MPDFSTSSPITPLATINLSLRQHCQVGMGITYKSAFNGSKSTSVIPLCWKGIFYDPGIEPWSRSFSLPSIECRESFMLTVLLRPRDQNGAKMAAVVPVKYLKNKCLA